MAKTPEELYAAAKSKPFGCTLRDMEKLLEAHCFTRRPKKKRDTQLWTFGGVLITLHRPHKKFVPPGAVSQVLACIDRAGAMQSPEKPDDTVN